MKVIFITLDYPTGINDYLILPSLDFAVMSSVVKENGDNCELIDMRINHYDMYQLEHLLIAKNKIEKIDLVCIESICNTHFNAVKAIKVCRHALGDDIVIALRGEVTTFLPVQTLERNAELDVAFVGESERALLDIIDYMKGTITERDIHNACLRNKNGEIINNNNCYTSNLNHLPLPDREVYDISAYIRRDSETIVRSSRGCPGNCSFCIKTKMSKFRLFTIKRFCDEIEILQRYGFQSFFFSDDTFAFSDQRLSDFAEEILKRKMHIRWTSNLRIKDINEYKIKTMKELGAYRVFVGIETINSASQKLANKNLTKQEVMDKISILKKYNLEFHASFIIGAPGDTEEDLMEIEKLLSEIKPTLVTFNQLKLFPGTDIYNSPEKYNILPFDPYWFEKDDWVYYPVFGTKELPPSQINKWTKRLYHTFFNTVS